MTLIKEIIKRNWKTVPFEPNKITLAISKAAKVAGEKDTAMPAKITSVVVEKLEQNYSMQPPSVEEIQDIVEEILIKSNYPKVAKVYIIYRHEQAKNRNDDQKLNFDTAPENSLLQVTKRTEELVAFDKDKITVAIYKAATSVGGHDHQMSEQLTNEVIWKLNQNFAPGDIPNVEDIQDTIEQVLIKRGHVKTAKAYILYREERARLRNST